MIKLVLTALFFFASNASASYYATHCSNADATLYWRTGHNDNLMIRMEDGEARSIDVNQLKIDFASEVVLSEVTVNDCSVSKMYSYTKIWAARVKIAPAMPMAQSETTFNKVIEDSVICRNHLNSRMGCP
jgi:hypothetical protein